MKCYTNLKMDVKEMFDSDDVDLFEKSCNMTPSVRLKLAILVQCQIKRLEDEIEFFSKTRMKGKKLPGRQASEKLILDNEIDPFYEMQYAKSAYVKFHKELTDTNTDVGMQALSEKLSTLADSKGFTEEGREMFIETTKVKTVLLNMFNALQGLARCERIVGSKAEGTATINSQTDTDVIITNPLVRIYKDSQNAETTMPYLIMVEDIKTPAGYVKLQLFYNGHPVHENHVKYYQSLFIHELIIDKNRVMLSNEFTDKQSNYLKHIEYEKHGPAATCKISEIGSIVDHVYAYVCEALPDEVMPWFKRKQRYDWPSEETMKLFEHMGCVIVAIGHENSQEQKLQWRLSFTNQEMYLMHNLNMTQYKCYVILKHFRTTLIKNVYSNSLSSYHLKTVLFHTIENSKSSIWQPKYLAYVILKCLHNLREWVAEMNCPNYFIPQENMFETKLNQVEKENLNFYLSAIQFDRQFDLRWLSHTYESQIKCKGDLVLICSYDIAQSLNKIHFEFTESMEKKGYPLNILIINKIIQCLEIFTEDNNCGLCPRLSRYTTGKSEIIVLAFFMRCAGIFDPLLQRFLNEMPTFEYIYPILINDSVVRSACCHVKKTFQTQVVNIMLMGCRRSIEQNHNMPFEIINVQGQLAGTAHLINTKLKQASILYTDGHHELVEASLKNAAKMKLDLPALSACFHSTEWRRQIRKIGSPFLMKRNLEVLQKLKPHQLTVDYLSHVVLTCLHFDFMEMLIVPENLQFEAFRTFGAPPYPRGILGYSDLNFVVIDPIIFLHYLRYKHYEAMNDNPSKNHVLRSLEKLLFHNERENNVSHVETTLNCLGHIYVTKGWHRLAISCFRKSMDEDSLYNAAKWHIMCLLFG